MSVRLCRWGNSTGLRLPQSLLETAGLAAGGYVSLRLLDNGDIRVRPMSGSVPAEAITETPASQAADAADAGDGWGDQW